MLTQEQRETNRRELVDAIFEQTGPERTGRFSWDGGRWIGQTLHLDGQHLTPDAEVAFVRGGDAVITLKRAGRVLITATTSWSRNFQATAQNVVTAALVAYSTTPVYQDDERAWRVWNS